MATAAKLNVKFAGYALGGSSVVAYSQSIAAETSVEIGTVVTVCFRVSDGSD